MIDAFVVDASVAMGWVHPAQATSETTAWLQHVADGAELVVPAIWPLELSNALLVLQRRRKVTAAERTAALRALAELPMHSDHESLARTFTDLSDLATKESLSVHDASYLELAVRRALPLACKDGPLREAASRNRLRVTA